MADQAGPVRGDLQGMIPPVMLHGEERSSSGDYKVVVTRNLSGPGRSSLKPARAAASRPLPFPCPADRPAPIRCTRTQPAAA